MTIRDYRPTLRVGHSEHVANIPFPHLIYGCEFEAKGRKYRVTPRESMDNLMKFIDGSEPGKLPYGWSEQTSPSMAASHNIPARGPNSRLWWSILAALLDSFVTTTTTTTTEKNQGTPHPCTLPAGMAAHAGRTNNREKDWPTLMGKLCSIQKY